MADDINKKIDGAPQNPEDSDNLFEKFRDHLGYLAKEVYETSKNAYDKALQSLEKWLLSKEKKVQQDTVDALGKLRDAVDKQSLHPEDSSRDVVTVNKAPLSSSSFSLYDRSSEVEQSINDAAIVIEHMIGEATSDGNIIASFIGRLMKNIWDTEG